jgi:hypothetical protein
VFWTLAKEVPRASRVGRCAVFTRHRYRPSRHRDAHPHSGNRQATLGGLGSGVTYTGFNNVFIATPDRGPFDGRTDVPYQDRFHLLHITVDTKAASFPNISTVLVDTRFLRDEWRRNFVGDAHAFDTSIPPEKFCLDPESGHPSGDVLLPLLWPWELPRGLK